VLVETGDPWRSLALAEVARAEGWAVEVVPAATTVLLDGIAALDRVERGLERAGSATARPPGRLVEVPVDYDGADLEEIAAAWSVSAADVVARHTEVEWVALFTGFAPGFAYLATTAAWPAVPRRQTPRTKVPAGAVGLADRWSGIYPTPSPGGWQLLGRTDLVLWDADRAEPALLTPGTRVRFVAR